MKLTVVLRSDHLAALHAQRYVLEIMHGSFPKPPDRDQCMAEIGSIFDDEADVDQYCNAWGQEDAEENWRRKRSEMQALDAILAAARIEGWTP